MQDNNAEHDRLVLARIFISRSYAFYPREKKVGVRVVVASSYWNGDVGSLSLIKR